MAIFRKLHTAFWQDAKVIEELTPEDKFFFIYLLTNPATTQIGIYQITKKQMSFELGYSIESINSLMDRFENHHKLIKYNPYTREIALKNWGKYNLDRSGKPMLDCVKKELEEVSDISLIEYVSKDIDKEKEKDLKSSNVGKYAKLYEQNIGLINGVAYEWIINISEEIDLKLFKKAIEIATDKGKCNKGYIGGIIRQWLNNNIKTYDDLKAYELNQGGQLNDRKSKYAREYENEDESVYQKPTEEQLRRVRELLESN